MSQFSCMWQPWGQDHPHFAPRIGHRNGSAHGTLGAYATAKCRCEGCRQWAADYGRDRKRQRTGSTEREWSAARRRDPTEYVGDNSWGRIWKQAVKGVMERQLFLPDGSERHEGPARRARVASRPGPAGPVFVELSHHVPGGVAFRVLGLVVLASAPSRNNPVMAGVLVDWRGGRDARGLDLRPEPPKPPPEQMAKVPGFQGDGEVTSL